MRPTAKNSKRKSGSTRAGRRKAPLYLAPYTDRDIRRPQRGCPLLLWRRGPGRGCRYTQLHSTSQRDDLEDDAARREIWTGNRESQKGPPLPSQGCDKVGPGHAKPETRRPRSELIATPAEQPPIELGHSRNSDFPTNHTNDTNGKAPSQFVFIRVIRGQSFNFYDY